MSCRPSSLTGLSSLQARKHTCFPLDVSRLGHHHGRLPGRYSPFHLLQLAYASGEEVGVAVSLFRHTGGHYLRYRPLRGYSGGKETIDLGRLAIETR